MKSPALAAINAIGFKNYAQRALWAAHVLKAATVSSPSVTVSPAIKTRVGRRAVAGAEAIPAFAALTAAQNTSGVAEGVARPARAGFLAIPASEGYAAVPARAAITASPAYPAGTAVPAYPAIAAIPAVEEITPILTAAAAVISPPILAVPGMSDAIEITYNSVTQLGNIIAYLPIATSPQTIGSNFEKIDEITPPIAMPNWIGSAMGQVNSTPLTAVPDTTLEGCLLEWARLSLLSSFNAGSITTVDHDFKGITRRCKKIDLTVSILSGYDYTANSPDFSYIDYKTFEGGGGSGGGMSQSIVSPELMW